VKFTPKLFFVLGLIGVVIGVSLYFLTRSTAILPTKRVFLPTPTLPPVSGVSPTVPLGPFLLDIPFGWAVEQFNSDKTEVVVTQNNPYRSALTLRAVLAELPNPVPSSAGKTKDGGTIGLLSEKSFLVWYADGRTYRFEMEYRGQGQLSPSYLLGILQTVRFSSD